MRVRIIPSNEAADAHDAAVIIDVLRAFTTSAFAFAAGAQSITLVRTVEEARELHERSPASALLGEVQGYPIDGFHYGNSPSALSALNLRETNLIMRTTCGTRAALEARGARLLVVASFVCAGATLRYLEQAGAQDVALVLSGRRDGKGGEDDQAVADYLAARVSTPALDPSPYLARLRQSPSAQKFLSESEVFPESDLTLAGEVDRFAFAQVARWRDGQLVLEATR